MFRLALRVTEADLGGGGGDPEDKKRGGRGKWNVSEYWEIRPPGVFSFDKWFPHEFSRFGNFSILKTWCRKKERRLLVWINVQQSSLNSEKFSVVKF